MEDARLRPFALAGLGAAVVTIALKLDYLTAYTVVGISLALVPRVIASWASRQQCRDCRGGPAGRSRGG